MTQKPFTWSWSKLKNYRTCPKRHYEVDIMKHFSEDGSEPIIWGKTVHDAMANYIDKDKPLPVTVERYKQWPEWALSFKSVGADIKVEQKLAIAKDFGPTGYFDNATWFRSVVDVNILLPKEYRSAITLDWKTGGSVQPEFEQLALSAQTVFAHYPDVDQVASYYVWLGHSTHTLKVYKRDDMVQLWNRLWPEIALMDEAYRTTTYPAKPSGLCKRHCPVKDCPYYGKGTQ